MTDLAAWLLEQIAEDEAVARGVLTQRWDAISFHDEARDDVPHIVRWSPARVLAECAAKRALVELHSDGGQSDGYTGAGYGGVDHACLECGSFGEYGVAWPCSTLRALAQPYRDRPGWRDEWEVET
ncbi:MAG TPA: DUF6221 family protein [Propionibacteriaceae bacterium]